MAMETEGMVCASPPSPAAPLSNSAVAAFNTSRKSPISVWKNSPSTERFGVRSESSLPSMVSLYCDFASNGMTMSFVSPTGLNTN